MLRRICLLFILLLTLWTRVSLAQSSLEQVELQTRIEAQITEKLRSVISTTLEKGAFDVSASVKIAEVIDKRVTEKTQDVKKEEKSPVPSDASLGLVNAELLLKKYQDEAKEKQSQRRETIEGKIERRYKITAISVSVGLDESLAEDYRSQFKQWLVKKVKSDYGAIASADVTVVKQKPIKPQVEKPKSLWDRVSEIQFLLGFLIMAATLMLLLLLSKMVLSRDAAENRRVSMQLEQMRSAQAPPLPMLPEKKEVLPALEDKSPEKPLQINMMTELRSIRDLVSKISLLAFENLASTEELLFAWLDAGERGCLKIALMIDSILSATQQQSSRMAQQPNPISSDGRRWTFQVPAEHQDKMAAVYKKMASLAPDSKRKLLEEVYWDLIAQKTLGSKFLSQPFGFLSDLPSQQVRTVLIDQSPQAKSIAVLHLPKDQREKFIQSLDAKGKEDLIVNALSMDEVPITDFEAVNETLKFQVKQAGTREGFVTLKPLMPSLLESFSVRDEIRLLHTVTPKLSDGGLSIKRIYPSLAFFDQYPSELRKVVVSRASNDELTVLIGAVPAFKETILSVCTPMVKTIIEDDLKAGKNFGDDLKEKNMVTLKTKLLQAINSMGLKMEALFPDGGSGGARAA